MTPLSKEDKLKQYAEVLKSLNKLKNDESAGLNKARLVRIVKQLEVVIEIIEKEN